MRNESGECVAQCDATRFGSFLLASQREQFVDSIAVR